MRRMLGRHEFVRSHGLGNDYLVVDGERLGFALDPERVRQICDRHTGVGSDGILERVPAPAGFDAAVRIFNPDGSEAEKSGNGTRIYAKFCIDHGYVTGSRLRMHTIGGPVSAEIIERPADRTVLRMSMGRASFRCADLPMDGRGRDEWVAEPLTVGDRALTATCVSVGNPHVVVMAPDADEAFARHYGPLIENHAQFPRRTNVQFIAPVDRRSVRALIWERGAGWTLASGTSSCAVAAACVRLGLTDRRVQVLMAGGTLEVVVGDDWELEQIGFAQEIARGTLSHDLLRALGVDG
jgi:diaminopimelate epimerase